MVGLIIAGVAWLTRRTPDGEVIDQPTVTSIPTPTTTPLLSPLAWSRVRYDEAAFGEGFEQVMDSVTVGGPGLVAVGGQSGGAAVWTSPDGITWSRVPHSTAFLGEALMSSVTAGGPGLVAVGSAGHPDSENAVVWTSPDGITWSRVPHNEVGGGAEMSSVTVGGPGLVAVGGATVWTSPDGITWSRIPHNEAVFGGEVEMRSVTAGGPGLVAVGGDGFGSRSGLDAAVWNARVED